MAQKIVKITLLGTKNLFLRTGQGHFQQKFIMTKYNAKVNKLTLTGNRTDVNKQICNIIY